MNAHQQERCRHCGGPIEAHPAPHTYGWRHTTGALWCTSGRSMARPNETD